MEYKPIDEKTVKVFPGQEIDLSNAEKFKKQLNQLKSKGFQHFMLDFQRVKRVDSTGLGKILMFHKTLRDSGGGVKIVNVKNNYIYKMFDMINLKRVIEID